MGFTLSTPWQKLPAAARKALLYGYDQQVHVRYQNRYGRQRSYYTSFEGAIPYIQRHHDEAESDSSRERYAGYMREVPCPVCDGFPAEAGLAGGHGRRQVDRGPVRAAHRRAGQAAARH